jgi:putative ABC transport system permease protein
MFAHYVVAALRRFATHKLHSAIGVVVLALGITCFIAAYLFADYFRNFDRAFAAADRIYFIGESLRSTQFGIDQPLNVFCALPVADQLRIDAPELEHVARVYRNQRSVVVGDTPSLSRVAYAEDGFLEIFGLQAVAGDARGALSRPGTAVLTKRSAERLFGADSPVGKTLTLSGSPKTDLTVAAVLADPPIQSHLASQGFGSLGFDVLVSWDVFDAVEKTPGIENWGNTPVVTYVQLAAGGPLTVAELDRRLAALVATHQPQELRAVVTIGLAAQPIAKLAPRLLQQQFEGVNRRPWRVDAFTSALLLGGALLAVACLNFINLATAEARGRAFEIGSRKALGASRGQIVRQELTATALRAALAIAVAFAALEPASALFAPPSQAWRTALAVPWAEPRFWSFAAALLAAATLAAGLYPALVLSRLRPVEALRLGSGGASGSTLRNVLVGVQFAAASFLVVAVIVLFTQRGELRETLLGRFADQYVGFFLGGQPATSIGPDVLATELGRSPAIKGATAMIQPPFQAAFQTRELARSKDEGAAKVRVAAMLVGYDYFETMEVPLLAGRVFLRDRADDVVPQTQAEAAARAGKSLPMVLDRAAARAFGWTDPSAALGEIIYAPGGAPGEIVGVVESVPQSIRASDGAGVVYTFSPRLAGYWLVRIDKNAVEAATAHIDAVMKKLAPDRAPPPRTFLDDLFTNAYWTFAATQRLLTTLAMFALAIAAIGLFGMASYMTSRRTREIGLRKAQGAKARQILVLLVWDYSKPALWASVAAFPFAWLAVERYLGMFANRAVLTPLPFVVALLATLLLAALSVSGFVLRAAYLRPAEALRHE